MGGFRKAALLAAIAAVALLAGCSRDEQADRRRLAQIEADGAALDHSLDALEARLLADQSRVALWEELKERHQHVSALATQNANEHLDAMVRFVARQEARGRAARSRRVASADPFDFGEAGKPRKRTHLRHSR